MRAPEAFEIGYVGTVTHMARFRQLVKSKLKERFMFLLKGRVKNNARVPSNIPHRYKRRNWEFLDELGASLQFEAH